MSSHQIKNFQSEQRGLAPGVREDLNFRRGKFSKNQGTAVGVTFLHLKPASQTTCGIYDHCLGSNTASVALLASMLGGSVPFTGRGWERMESATRALGVELVPCHE